MNVGDPTNLESGHAFGYNSSGAGKYVVPYVNSNYSSDPIYVAYGNGAEAWSKYAIDSTNFVSESGPSAAWGGTTTTNGNWVLVWQGRTSSPDRLLYHSTATNPTAASSWATRTAVSVGGSNVSGISRPMVTYAPVADKFVLAWVDLTSRTVRSAVATRGTTLTWQNGDDTQQRTVRGPGLACVKGPGGTPTYDDCLLAWNYNNGIENIWSSRGWTDPNYGFGFKVSAPKPQNSADYTKLPVDVALKFDSTNGGANLALMAWTAFTYPYAWFFSSKSTTSQLTSWPAGSAPSGPGTGIVCGTSLEYSATYSEWTAVHSR